MAKEDWKYSWDFTCPNCGEEWQFGMSEGVHAQYAAALLDADYHVSHLKCGECDGTIQRRIALSIYGVCTMDLFYIAPDLMQTPEIKYRYPKEFTPPPETAYVAEGAG